ncbi:hypothetical protein ASD78_15455 [Lysobacter sp. Root667]|uniref:hypothetical protein n=1 Tax=Lysobacter sp. Root667 TaxID=1736581 RepID=UPI0006F8FFD2|nr:hypothetical protein [Lysobacter sp. Root667]KRA72997.1 hypothetical protein ASD78_15455 [Lysobacter sp. Root667]
MDRSQAPRILLSPPQRIRSVSRVALLQCLRRRDAAGVGTGMKGLTGFVLVATLCACALVRAGEAPLLPPPLPWHVNAYIGFERAAEFDQAGIPERWYYQNALQIDSALVKLHKQTVVCKAGRLYASEGDGGAMFYEGEMLGSLEEGRAVLRYAGCDQCIPPTTAPEPLDLPVRRVSPSVILLGAASYSREAEPYPKRCPSGL